MPARELDHERLCMVVTVEGRGLAEAFFEFELRVSGYFPGTLSNIGKHRILYADEWLVDFLRDSSTSWEHQVPLALAYYTYSLCCSVRSSEDNGGAGQLLDLPAILS